MSHNNTCFQIELPLELRAKLAEISFKVSVTGDRPVYNDDHSDLEHGG